MIRTIDQAYNELRERDPETAISRHLVRELVRNGKVPSLKADNKRLVDVDVLIDYVNRITNGILD